MSSTGHSLPFQRAGGPMGSGAPFRPYPDEGDDPDEDEDGEGGYGEPGEFDQQDEEDEEEEETWQVCHHRLTSAWEPA
jgi:hypothetical protein